MTSGVNMSSRWAMFIILPPHGVWPNCLVRGSKGCGEKTGRCFPRLPACDILPHAADCARVFRIAVSSRTEPSFGGDARQSRERGGQLDIVIRAIFQPPGRVVDVGLH